MDRTHAHPTNGRIGSRRYFSAGVITAVAVMIAASGTLLAGAASASRSVAVRSGHVACKGTPVKYLITDQTTGSPGTPGDTAIQDGAKAAAANVNSTCEMGRPLDLIICNTYGTTPGLTTCADEAVQDHVIAVTAQFQGATVNPIIEPAGIPNFATFTNDPSDENPDVLGSSSALLQIAGFTALAADAGAKSVVFVALGYPVTEAGYAIVQHQAPKLGLKVLGSVYYPITATDMTSYVAQALASHPGAIIYETDPTHQIAFFQAEHVMGVNFKKVLQIGSTVSFPPSLFQSIGKVGNNVLVTSETAPPSESYNPGIKEYLAELRKIGVNPTGSNVSQQGIIGYTAVHALADTLKGTKTFTSANLIHLARKHGVYNYPQMAPFDFSHYLFPGDSVLGPIHLNEDSIALLKQENGKLVPIVNGYVPINKKIAASQLINS